VTRAIPSLTVFRAIVASPTGQHIIEEATRTSRRTTIPGRADVSWLVAVIVAIFLAVTTGAANRGGQNSWNDVRVSTTSRTR
jgi:hypothetical protein